MVSALSEQLSTMIKLYQETEAISYHSIQVHGSWKQVNLCDTKANSSCKFVAYYDSSCSVSAISGEYLKPNEQVSGWPGHVRSMRVLDGSWGPMAILSLEPLQRVEQSGGGSISSMPHCMQVSTFCFVNFNAASPIVTLSKLSRWPEP